MQRNTILRVLLESRTFSITDSKFTPSGHRPRSSFIEHIHRVFTVRNFLAIVTLFTIRLRFLPVILGWAHRMGRPACAMPYRSPLSYLTSVLCIAFSPFAPEQVPTTVYPFQGRRNLGGTHVARVHDYRFYSKNIFFFLSPITVFWEKLERVKNIKIQRDVKVNTTT